MSQYNCPLIQLGGDTMDLMFKLPVILVLAIINASLLGGMSVLIGLQTNEQ